MPVKILDSSFFFVNIPLNGEFAIPSAVESEIKDLMAKSKLETLKAKGLFVSEPSAASREQVITAARESGDITVISDTDIDVVALALELHGDVVTDDFALSNTAQTLGIKVIPLKQRVARKRKWKYRCIGCRSSHKSPGFCDVCGAEIERVFK